MNIVYMSMLQFIIQEHKTIMNLELNNLFCHSHKDTLIRDDERASHFFFIDKHEMNTKFICTHTQTISIYTHPCTFVHCLMRSKRKFSLCDSKAFCTSKQIFIITNSNRFKIECQFFVFSAAACLQ